MLRRRRKKKSRAEAHGLEEPQVLRGLLEGENGSVDWAGKRESEAEGEGEKEKVEEGEGQRRRTKKKSRAEAHGLEKLQVLRGLIDVEDGSVVVDLPNLGAQYLFLLSCVFIA